MLVTINEKGVTKKCAILNVTSTNFLALSTIEYYLICEEVRLYSMISDKRSNAKIAKLFLSSYIFVSSNYFLTTVKVSFSFNISYSVNLPLSAEHTNSIRRKRTTLSF